MNHTTHTPGPWHVAQDKGPPYITAAPTWQRVATIKETDNADEHAANARLIAAAPDLLAACKAAFARLQHKAETCRNDAWKMSDQKAFEACEVAIAKAEGTEHR